jgi:hypothetical protein
MFKNYSPGKSLGCGRGANPGNEAENQQDQGKGPAFAISIHGFLA